MRRNIRGVPRGGRGGHNWRSAPAPPSGGPLMTDHFGLMDIDKELELLQRKREIIEQQQQQQQQQRILSNEFHGINNYDESYSQSSRFDGHAYPSFNDRRDFNPHSRKRPIPVWEAELPCKVWEGEIPNKRFSGMVRPRTRAPRPAAPPPLMTAPFFNTSFQNPRHWVRSQNTSFKPKPVKKDATAKVTKPAAAKVTKPAAAKVTKPAASPAPNKLNTYSVAERKKLITKAIGQPSGNLGPDRLRPDCEPSKQVKGRLELALGAIMKEIKARVDPTIYRSLGVMREMKTIVRDRIREVMMNKNVDCSATVIRRYREVYNMQSDKEIASHAIEAQTEDVTITNIDDPEKYFKINMHKIMHRRLKSMLNKLEQVSRGDTKSIVPPQKIIDDLLDAESGQESLDSKMTSSEKFKELEKWMTLKLTVLIKKFIPYMKLMDLDTKYSQLKDMVTTETVKMLMQKEIKDGIQLECSDEIIATVKASLNLTQPKPNIMPSKPLLYFTKLMGKPGLPKRNQMEIFFEQFKPKSIKKHRTVHNLLFVGFLEKENFEKFLTFDGTKIGKHVLSIRVSERAQSKKQGNNPNQLDDKLIGDELDEQITDLLTSIKNSEDLEEDDSAADTAGTNEGEDNADITTSDVKCDPEDASNDIANNDNENVEGSIAEKADENIAENVDENIGENADKNITENAEEGITENADANNAVEPKSADKNGHSGEEKASKDNGLEAESADKVQPLDAKPMGRSTPVRMSSKLATPGRIQTRRSSRIAPNDA